MKSWIWLLALGCSTPAPEVPTPPPTPAVDVSKYTGIFQGPLPARWDRAGDPALEQKVQLGRILYYDPALSLNNDISCNSCHQLDRFGVDNQPTSPGHQGQRGDRNSPTVYNAAGHFVQFWDGRAVDVEAQAKGPILNPIEMAMPSEPEVIQRLSAKEEYKKLFADAFPGVSDPITYDNLAAAIGAFERRLSTPGRFDKFLGGDGAALTPEEVAGLDLFVSSGCVACHGGTLVGGTMYQKIGVVKPYETADLGRQKVTNAPADEKMFKVPSLRNISKTGPYFHDGSVATLDDAIRKMGEHQLGKTFTDAEVASIATFLGALDGEVDAAYIAKPAIP